MADRTKDPKNPFHRRDSPKRGEAVTYPIRLNKYIAKSGLCSRRKAVDFVKEGEVTVNGEVEILPYRLIELEDVVTVKGEPIKPEEHLVYLLLNKPKDVITTTDDESNRRTVLDLVSWPGPERLYPVGRLDRYTTGLLLITNDGDLTKKLSHPSHQVKKIYEVTLDRDLSQEHFQKIEAGHTLEDGLVPVHSLVHPKEAHKSVVEISISVGRNRIVRRLFENFEYRIVRLDRVFLGGLTKKNLPRGMHRPLTPREIVMLKHFV